MKLNFVEVAGSGVSTRTNLSGLSTFKAQNEDEAYLVHGSDGSPAARCWVLRTAQIQASQYHYLEPAPNLMSTPNRTDLKIHIRDSQS